MYWSIDIFFVEKILLIYSGMVVLGYFFCDNLIPSFLKIFFLGKKVDRKPSIAISFLKHKVTFFNRL